MQHGVENEEQAAQRYILQKKVEGETLTLSEVGLRVHVDKVFIGASTDRVATDFTGSVHLLEMKNPLNLGTAICFWASQPSKTVSSCWKRV